MSKMSSPLKAMPNYTTYPINEIKFHKISVKEKHLSTDFEVEIPYMD